MEFVRGFDRPMAVVFMSLLSTCAAAGGFAWQWGASGQACTAACSDAGLVCVEGSGEPYSKIDSQAAFEAAKGAVSCPGGYFGQSDNMAPYQYNGYPTSTGVKCYWQTGSRGTCAASSTAFTRLCACQCAAGSFSPSDTQLYPCTSCVAGKTSASGQSECKDCVAGKTSASGQSECKDCVAGKTSASPFTACMAAPGADTESDSSSSSSSSSSSGKLTDKGGGVVVGVLATVAVVSAVVGVFIGCWSPGDGSASAARHAAARPGIIINHA